MGGAPLSDDEKVFPACAGMFRSSVVTARNFSGFPRVRGDVPSKPVKILIPALVFPACAGMFPYLFSLKGATGGFPRVRGDVPPRVYQTRQHDKFSPRARGCSHLSVVSAVDNRVFPACAGMFPNDASRR